MSGIKHFESELIATAKALCAEGKGFLAADESTGTIQKRLASINVENTPENRRAYRELLFTAPGDWQNYISGIILFKETLLDHAQDGKPFVQVIKDKQVIPGIKVDLGTTAVEGGNEAETYTKGLEIDENGEGLGDRCKKYYEVGARFSKWRAVLRIDAAKGSPSDVAVQRNATDLATYARVCQENGLVPIIEPEVLMDGGHSIEEAFAVTVKVLKKTYEECVKQGVLLPGSVLKPNMVLSGMENPNKAPPEVVAKFTVDALLEAVPKEVPGIFFLSGGQSEEEATLNLNAINKRAKEVGGVPFHISFSYGRALQQSTLRAWQGKPENVAAAQAAYVERAKANSQAQLGAYAGTGAAGAAAESLYQKNYTY